MRGPAVRISLASRVDAATSSAKKRPPEVLMWTPPLHGESLTISCCGQDFLACTRTFYATLRSVSTGYRSQKHQRCPEIPITPLSDQTSNAASADLEGKAPASAGVCYRRRRNIMNRSGCRLKPIAPRPATDTYTPSSAVSAVSLDPKDYVYPHADYVWGVPQQLHPGMLQQSHGCMSPFVAANAGVYGAYGPVVTSQWNQPMPHYQSHLNPPTAGTSRNRHTALPKRICTIQGPEVTLSAHLELHVCSRLRSLQPQRGHQTLEVVLVCLEYYVCIEHAYKEVFVSLQYKDVPRVARDCLARVYRWSVVQCRRTAIFEPSRKWALVLWEYTTQIFSQICPD